MALTRQQLASMIEHTLLKPEATTAQIVALCDEAIAWGFAAVCVNPIHAGRAAMRLRGANVRVVSVAGFPLGASCTSAKVEEARRAVADGATEVDMVLRIGDLIDNEVHAVRDDVAAVAEAVHEASPGHALKVILETAALSEAQIVRGCELCAEAGADYLKTSTGFHPAGGASVAAVRLLSEQGRRFGMKVKAAGGIRDRMTAESMVAAGASRLGMSASVSVMESFAEGDRGQGARA